MSKQTTTTKIPIENLSVGMLITGLDRPWYATPFMSHRMAITTETEIETLKACGVKLVEVEIEEAPAAAPPATMPAPVETSSEPTTQSRPAPPSADPASTSFEDELRPAQLGYHQAKLAVQRALDDAKMGRAFSTDAVVSAVDSLSDSILRNPHALASLSRLKQHDEYTYYHSVNSCVLAMVLGRQLNMGREALRTLGLGVLLHDVGKTQVPNELLNRPGKLQPDETEIIKRHVLGGAEFLSTTMKMGDEVLLPVLEHHERMDGSGYPHRRKRPELSEFGLIAGVVDVYDALTSDRPYRKAISPHQALQTLYDLARRGQLESACVERFIRCMGIYPVGSCVQLNSGEIAVVSKVNPSQTLNPVVLIVRETYSGAALRPRPFDLALQSGKAIKRISEVLNPGAVGIVPNEILDVAQFGESSLHSVCR